MAIPEDAGKSSLMSARSPVSRSLVFVGYSHRNRKPHLERLKTHLKPLAREGLVDYWDDTRIHPSAKWRREIAQAVAEARVAVLLISADFYASDFIAKNELPPLLRRNAQKTLDVLPVIVGQSRFARDPKLSRFQAVNDPGKPLANLRATERERIWDHVAQEVEQRVAMRSAGRGVTMIDRLEPQLRAVVQGTPVRRARTHRVMIKPMGKRIVGTVAGKPAKTITAADLRKLPRKDLAHIRMHERSMERHYDRWQQLYPKRADPRAHRELQRAVKAMKNDLVGIISFLQSLGLDLEDHYAQIRHVVETA